MSKFRSFVLRFGLILRLILRL